MRLHEIVVLLSGANVHCEHFGGFNMKHKRFFSVITLTAAFGLTLTACGGTPSATPTSPDVETLAPSTPSPSESSKKSTRGNIVKSLSEPAGITDAQGDTLATFTVNSITPDAPCTGPYPTPAENGHIVVLDVTIETTPELASDDGSYSTFDMNAAMFKFVGGNGTTFNGDLGSMAAYACLPDEEQVGSNGGGVGPAEKVTGKIAIDVPETAGTLIFKSYLTSGVGGWEWTF